MINLSFVIRNALRFFLLLYFSSCGIKGKPLPPEKVQLAASTSVAASGASSSAVSSSVVTSSPVSASTTSHPTRARQNSLQKKQK